EEHEESNFIFKITKSSSLLKINRHNGFLHISQCKMQFHGFRLEGASILEVDYTQIPQYKFLDNCPATSMTARVVLWVYTFSVLSTTRHIAKLLQRVKHNKAP